VDVLIQYGADPSITDATGRTGQQISDFMKKNISIQKTIGSKKNFSLFVFCPIQYFFHEFEEKKEHIQEFETIYESFCNGEPNVELEDFLMKQLKSGKFNELFPNSFFRLNSKELFLSCLFKAKENNTWSSELKKKCRQLEEKIEMSGKFKELEIYKNVFELIFDDWVKEKSAFMKELDSLVNTKLNLSESVTSSMINDVKKSSKLRLLFPEIEEAFKILKLFQSKNYDSKFEVFHQMNVEIEKLKSEIGKMNSKEIKKK
jgi:hypothetical protein